MGKWKRERKVQFRWERGDEEGGDCIVTAVCYPAEKGSREAGGLMVYPGAPAYAELESVVDADDNDIINSLSEDSVEQLCDEAMEVLAAELDD